jgi:hypothetical protein
MFLAHKIFFVMLFSSAALLSGTGPSRSSSNRGYYQLNTSCICEDGTEIKAVSEEDKLIKKRIAILKNDDTRPEKIKAIVSLYQSHLELFVTPENYLSILSSKEDNITVRKAAEAFIKIHTGDFFKTKPSAPQIFKMADEIIYSINGAINFKNRAFSALKSPEEYITIIKIKRLDENYKNATAIAIRDSLIQFKNTEPNIDQVMQVHKYLLTIQSDVDITISALIKLKEVFLEVFTGIERIRLLDLGTKNPHRSYKSQLLEFKKLHNLPE